MKEIATKLFPAAAFSFLISATAAYASPCELLDQSVPRGALTASLGNNQFARAQTFYAARTGQLSSAVLNMFAASAGGAIVTVHITDTSPSGEPTNNILGTATALLAIGSVDPLTVDFSTSVPQTAGTRYAMVVTADAQVGWWGKSDSYPAGDMYFSSDNGGTWSIQGGTEGYDLAFVTYVEVSDADRLGGICQQE